MLVLDHIDAKVKARNSVGSLDAIFKDNWVFDHKKVFCVEQFQDAKDVKRTFK